MFFPAPQTFYSFVNPLNVNITFYCVQFLPLSATPYGTAPGYDDFNKPAPVEDVDVNPSASLNEWLNFPSSQDLQV